MPHDASSDRRAAAKRRPSLRVVARALLGLAEVAITERNWPEATDYITRARTAGPNDPAPGIALVKLESLRQDWKDAVTTASRIADAVNQEFHKQVASVLDSRRVDVNVADTGSPSVPLHARGTALSRSNLRVPSLTLCRS